MAMVIIYALCWLPLHCVTVLGDLQPTIWDFDGIQLVWIACHWLAVSSCCWNPIVYYWTNDTLRAGFTHTLRTLCVCMRRQSTVAMTVRHGQVVYQSVLRGGSLRLRGEKEIRRTTPHHRVRRTNSHRSNNIELCQLRGSQATGRSVQASPVVRAATRSC